MPTKKLDIALPIATKKDNTRSINDLGFITSGMTSLVSLTTSFCKLKIVLFSSNSTVSFLDYYSKNHLPHSLLDIPFLIVHMILSYWYYRYI